MQPRLNFVTLGVADLARARLFYEKLGFKASSASQGDIVFFQLGAVVLALFPRHELANDAGVAPIEASPFSGVTLAQNQLSKHNVDAVLSEAAAAGARIVKPAQDAVWGGYSGYFADPDGHLWEIAYNPFVTLDETGVCRLPD